LTAPPAAKPQPKTFSHAIARSSLAGSQTLASTTAGEDPLATALEKYALASEKVGEARLAQDAQIQSRFLAGWNTTLNTNLMFAAKARKNVENARLMLDSVKAKHRTTEGDLDSLSEEARSEIEQAEDEFVGQTEEAVSVMKNVRSNLMSGEAVGDLLIMCSRSSILPNPSGTWRTLLPLSWNTTSAPTRS
jgi:hypothetical protein